MRSPHGDLTVSRDISEVKFHLYTRVDSSEE